jgi:hypothetical protein
VNQNHPSSRRTGGERSEGLGYKFQGDLRGEEAKSLSCKGRRNPYHGIWKGYMVEIHVLQKERTSGKILCGVRKTTEAQSSEFHRGLRSGKETLHRIVDFGGREKRKWSVD